MVVTYFIERSLSKRIRLLQQSNLDCTCLYDQRQADVCLESAVLLQLVQIFAAPEIRQPKMGFFQLLIACLVLALAPTWSYVIKYEEPLEAREPNITTVVFELFTPFNPTRPQILELDNLELLQKSYFDPSLPTKIFAHGWNGSPMSAYSTRDAYLYREECNFIAVDWSVLASGIEYPLIVERDVPRAAIHTGKFIDFLVENTQTPFSSIHLMGHSLGAHVAGGAGAAVTLGRVPRITGLDPAGPFFSLNDTDTRLDPSDGDFVDIIHTNGGTLLGDELGFLPPIGHIDFYPNGGQFQPGCSELGLTAQGRGGCDHGRSVTYFTESILSDVGFRAVECATEEDFVAGLCDDNQAVFMGDPTPTTARGIYYLRTSDKQPYALG
ncbi:pancreatic lipase-related protein 3-like [Daphnia pulicaria]|uniref:pancreatic lipase-related protein 3-like n=1 Tax=Daphnia pulicaria TaxID=35523 RepID=UPI001EEA093D|nr:pancreatic lipase-related protein 3-like [Daphnia pulicaria]